MALVSSKPPAIWRAVPRALLVGEIEIGPVPAERALLRRTTPELMVRPPVQPELAEERMSLPAPFLVRAFVRAEKANGFATVRVLPPVTLSALLAALRLIVRAVVKVPDTPSPVAQVEPLAVMVTELARSPRAASELTFTRPSWMRRVFPAPPNVFTPLRVRIPPPSLVSVKPEPASEIAPPTVKPFAVTVTAVSSLRETAPAPRS